MIDLLKNVFAKCNSQYVKFLNLFSFTFKDDEDEEEEEEEEDDTHDEL